MCIYICLCIFCISLDSFPVSELESNRAWFVSWASNGASLLSSHYRIINLLIINHHINKEQENFHTSLIVIHFRILMSSTISGVKKKILFWIDFLIENPFPQHKTAGRRTSWWWGWVWLTWQLAATEMENYCKTEGMKKHMPEGDKIMAPFFCPTASEVSFNSETLQAEAPYGKQGL